MASSAAGAAAGNLADFVDQLWLTGKVRVSAEALDPIRDVVREEAWLRLVLHAGDDEIHLPGTPPRPARPAGEWALVLLYRACGLLVQRASSDEVVQQQLAVPCPEAASPEVCYAVDLSFRYLADLLRLVEATSKSDVLATELRRLAREWPLSSPGIVFPPPAPELADVAPWIQHDCLRRLYVDRVLSRGDVSRLAPADVAREAVRAIGHYPELCPKVAAALAPEKEMA